jgi:hypothetical protein
MSFIYREISSQTSGNETLIVYNNEAPLGFMVEDNKKWSVLLPGKNLFEPETFSDKNDAAKHLNSLRT